MEVIRFTIHFSEAESKRGEGAEGGEGNKEATRAPGLTTRSKDATRSKGHRYQEQRRLLGAPGIATRSKDAILGAPGRTTSNKKLLVTLGTRSY